MREIKFRAWNYNAIKEKYEMLSFESIKENGGTYFFEPQKFKPNQHIIMQYTGLKDKNGKEIYFDDLYKDEYGDIFKVIQMECGRYALQMVSNDYVDEFIQWDYVDEFIQWDCVEIIGNIYENPELLNN